MQLDVTSIFTYDQAPHIHSHQCLHRRRLHPHSHHNHPHHHRHSQVIVLERNRRIAKAYARAPVLTVNGTEDGFDGFR